MQRVPLRWRKKWYHKPMARYTAPAVSVALAFAFLLGVAHAQSLIAPPQQQEVPLPAPLIYRHCSAGWLITGYFTPVESDYSGKLDKVYVGGVLESFPDAFLNAVMLQGSGLLPDGSYLSYGSGWRVASTSVVSSGQAIRMGDIATDQRLLPYGTRVVIQGQVFIAEDTGGAIVGKHIDIYEGLGRAAQQRAIEVTSTEKICVI